MSLRLRGKNRTEAIRRAAQKLAKLHRRADESTSAIYYFPSEEEIRLVEISKEALTTWEIFPISFDPDLKVGIPYPSTIILLSGKEWAAVQRGRLALPESWDWRRSEPLLDAAA